VNNFLIACRDGQNVLRGALNIVSAYKPNATFKGLSAVCKA